MKAVALCIFLSPQRFSVYFSCQFACTQNKLNTFVIQALLKDFFVINSKDVKLLQHLINLPQSSEIPREQQATRTQSKIINKNKQTISTFEFRSPNKQLNEISNTRS